MSEFDELLKRVRYFERIDEKYTGDIGEEVRKRTPTEIELDKLDEKRCPICRVYKESPKKWVKDESGLICKSCWTRKVDLIAEWEAVAADLCPCCGDKHDLYYRNIFKTRILCRSCLMIFKGQIGYVEKWVLGSTVRYEIDPLAITHLRKELGISLQKFADMCGWSKSYQSRLENGDYQTISEETKDKISDVFKRYAL